MTKSFRDDAALMSKDRMRYDLLVQDALRSVVKAALQRVASEGLPGNHHFFISFRTDAEGVEISPALHEQYPAEMTIVLQYQFWNLTIGEDAFSVGLSFNQVPQMLRIPFAAITDFHDPAAPFQLSLRPRPDGSPTVSESPVKGGATIESTNFADAQRAPRKPKTAGETGAVVNLDAFRKK